MLRPNPKFSEISPSRRGEAFGQTISELKPKFLSRMLRPNPQIGLLPILYSDPKSVVEDPHPHPLSQRGRGEKTDFINHLGLL